MSLNEEDPEQSWKHCDWPGNSALPKQFQFGITSDNALFGFFPWIWIIWIRNMHAVSASIATSELCELYANG